MSFKPLLAAILVTAGAGGHAATITWNEWTSNTAGTMGTVTVDFSDGGNSSAWVANYPSWKPTATWADGGVIDNAPAQTDGIMKLTGGTSKVNTLTFSTAVVDPVFAIWSLGGSGTTASFDFIGATPIFVAGGSNAEYGGSAISVVGNIVSRHRGQRQCDDQGHLQQPVLDQSAG